MAAADYCYGGGSRCRYTGESNELCSPCDFHRAMRAGDVAGMSRALTDPEDDQRFPSGIELEQAWRLPDGRWRLIMIARTEYE